MARGSSNSLEFFTLIACRINQSPSKPIITPEGMVIRPVKVGLIVRGHKSIE